MNVRSLALAFLVEKETDLLFVGLGLRLVGNRALADPLLFPKLHDGTAGLQIWRIFDFSSF